MSKRKCSENVGCIGFEDQNGKKVAVSTTSIEAFRSINDGNVNATPTVVVSSTRTGAGRGGSHTTAGRRMNNNTVSDNVTPNANATRLMGKKRRGEFPPRMYDVREVDFIDFSLSSNVCDRRYGRYGDHERRQKE